MQTTLAFSGEMVMNVALVLLYLGITAFLGWLGWRKTHTASDYMVAGRKAHPFIMAMSYGATFISTSAIVGFGGVAGNFGMSLLWLTFLNIFVGIFIAFVFLGGATRRVGQRLDAHTFPEFLGRRYDSKFIQVFVGSVIFLFMPLYAAAVLIGGSEFIVKQFDLSYNWVLPAFTAVVAVYVLAGGLKGVMYTDAFQGTIMVLGMIVLLVATYFMVGGFTGGHEALGDLRPIVPQGLQTIGHQGWTSMPKFGFGGPQYNLWWIVISSITVGVGIGVLAQPQLVVRFMTVKSQRELNKAVVWGGLFILLIPGAAYVVGSLSNVYFSKSGVVLAGKVVQTLDEDGKPTDVAKAANPEKARYVVIHLMAQDKASKKWDYVYETDPKTKAVVKDKAGKAKPKLASIVKLDERSAEQAQDVKGEPVTVTRGRSGAIVNAAGNSDQIIPTYIKSAMPPWFGVVFLLTLMAAAMSTMSSQYHTMGTALGRDVVERVTGTKAGGLVITRIGMLVGIVLSVLFAFYARGGERGDYIISRATAVFFGLCAATFLPAFAGGLFFKRLTKAGAIASMVTGCLASLFWLLLVKQKEAGDIGLVQLLTGGQRSLLMNYPNWPEVDSVLIALPLSILAAIVASLLTTPPSKEHLERCFGAGEIT